MILDLQLTEFPEKTLPSSHGLVRMPAQYMSKKMCGLLDVIENKTL